MINTFFTLEKLKQILPNVDNVEKWYNELMRFLPLFEITTKERVIMFLAQCCHESGDFKFLKENLNYSAEGLMTTWPSRFPTVEIAIKYARRPELIANKVYANRMGNGPETSGDGWRYSGKGLIQLTGKYNYEKFALFAHKKLEEIPNYLLTEEGAVHSACWFWGTHGLNKYSDNNDVESVTKIINGGEFGLNERKHKHQKITQIIND